MKFFYETCHTSESPEFNTQGLPEKAINELVLEANPCVVVLVNWDA